MATGQLINATVATEDVNISSQPSTFLVSVSEGGTGASSVSAMKQTFGLRDADIVNLIYPVGSIYMSVGNADPTALFGGTWERLEDRFLLGAGSTYTAGDTGGEATHTLTENEIPSHHHSITANRTSIEASGYGFVANGPFTDRGLILRNTADMATTNTGGGQAHNNMPPYLVVYMWKRTA